MRAVLKKDKISTIVHAKDVNKFQLAYCNLLKSNMDGLKRQKKQKDYLFNLDADPRQENAENCVRFYLGTKGFPVLLSGHILCTS